MNSRNKDTHIVFGRASKGTFDRSGVFNGDRLVCLYDVMNIGPVCEPGQPEKAEARKKWLAEIYDGSLCFDDSRPEANIVDQDLETIEKLARETGPDDRLFLWTGFDPNEILGTARLLSHLLVKSENIFRADFPNVAVTTRLGKTVYPKALYVTDPSQVGEFRTRFIRLTDTKLAEWKNTWERFRTDDFVLRTLDREGKLTAQDEACFDGLLKSRCTDEFQHPARIVGHTLIDTDSNTGEGYLYWRLKHLIGAGELEARGTLESPRTYEVRRKQQKT